MRVVNPNSVELNLYGEAGFYVIATVGLIGGMQFVNDMLQNANGQVAYRLQCKLDIGAMTPSIRIEKTGIFSP